MVRCFSCKAVGDVGRWRDAGWPAVVAVPRSGPAVPVVDQETGKATGTGAASVRMREARLLRRQQRIPARRPGRRAKPGCPHRLLSSVGRPHSGDGREDGRPGRPICVGRPGRNRDYLDGAKNYRRHLPADVPAKNSGHWSSTPRRPARNYRRRNASRARTMQNPGSTRIPTAPSTSPSDHNHPTAMTATGVRRSPVRVDCASFASTGRSNPGSNQTRRPGEVELLPDGAF